MNLSILKAFLDRLSVRTKLIGVGIIAFVAGTFFGGKSVSEGNGRYVPWGVNMLDTQTGQIYMIDQNAQHLRRGPSLPKWYER